jgi:hypothetical protein
VNTTTIPLEDLHRQAKDRPSTYVADVLAEAVEVTATHYTLTLETYERLKRKYRDLSCSLRGDQVGEVQCESCRGKVMAKVFACSVHGRCALFSKPLEGVKSCRACNDRQPITAT